MWASKVDFFDHGRDYASLTIICFSRGPLQRAENFSIYKVARDLQPYETLANSRMDVRNVNPYLGYHPSKIYEI